MEHRRDMRLRGGLRELEREIIRLLGEAHGRGLIDVSISDLAQTLNADRHQVSDTCGRLRQRGDLDSTEEPSRAALSAQGLATYRSLAAGSPGSKLMSRLSPPTAAANMLPHELEFTSAVQCVLKTLQERCFGWEKVVNASSLGRQEKARLRKLGRAFLEHPATFSLLEKLLLDAENQIV